MNAAQTMIAAAQRLVTSGCPAGFEFREAVGADDRVTMRRLLLELNDHMIAQARERLIEQSDAIYEQLTAE